MPVIVRDKKFTAAGEIDYQLDVMSAAVGWFGDTLLTNGALYPEHAAPRWLAALAAAAQFCHQR